MITSEKQLVYLDDVIRILDHVLVCDHPTLMVEYIKYKIEHLNTINITDMEDKDVE